MTASVGAGGYTEPRNKGARQRFAALSTVRQEMVAARSAELYQIGGVNISACWMSALADVEAIDAAARERDWWNTALREGR